jgi:hypothetical protein
MGDRVVEGTGLEILFAPYRLVLFFHKTSLYLREISQLWRSSSVRVPHRTNVFGSIFGSMSVPAACLCCRSILEICARKSFADTASLPYFASTRASPLRSESSIKPICLIFEAVRSWQKCSIQKESLRHSVKAKNVVVLDYPIISKRLECRLSGILSLGLMALQMGRDQAGLDQHYLGYLSQVL